MYRALYGEGGFTLNLPELTLLLSHFFDFLRFLINMSDWCTMGKKPPIFM